MGDEDAIVHLAKRHGTHVHFQKANEFAAIFFGLLVGYSVLALISSKVKRLRPVVRVLRSSVVLIILWTALCLWGLLSHFNPQPIQLARRCGQLGIASSTIAVFLALKPALLPRTYQVPLTLIHKWIGRTAIVLGLFHGIVYVVSYTTAASENKEKRHEGHHHHHHLFSLFNVFGMISLILFVTIFVVSLSPIRRRTYALFYALHWPLVTAIYILMIWHARPSAWLMVTVALLLLALQVVLRVAMSKPVKITKIESFGTNLKLITFEPAVPEAKLKGAASHVRLSTPLLHPMTWLRPSHPYTLVGRNQLVVRETRFRIREEDFYSLSGPFKAPIEPTDYTHILAIVGGSGVSVLPSFAHIPEIKTKLVWVTRSSAETEVLRPLRLSQCDVYVTELPDGSAPEHEDFELQEFTIDEDYDEEHGDEEALLETRLSANDGKELRQFNGRPSLTKVASEFFSTTTEAACVVACGPKSLVDDVERWTDGTKYDFWAEIFAL